MNHRSLLTFALLCLFCLPASAQSIQSVSPDTVFRGQTLTLTITGQGTNFYQATQATQATTTSWLARGIDVILPAINVVQSPTNLNSIYSIPNTAALGFWDVYATDLSGVLVLPNGVFIDVLIGNDPAGPEIRESLRIHPNPVSDRFTLEYSLPRFAEVEVTVMDIHGRKVRQLLQTEKGPGVHQEQFNVYGLPFSNEVFLVVLRVDDMRFATKVALMR
ncbi:MAG: hypothetical protein AAGN35_02885 [Bacteroidota bacterium]